MIQNKISLETLGQLVRQNEVYNRETVGAILPPGGGGVLPYKRDGDAHRKF